MFGQRANVDPSLRNSINTNKIFDMLGECASNAAILAVLSEPDINVQAIGEDGFTMLQGAAIQCNGPIATRLIEMGANINAANQFQETPLHLAAMYASPACVKALLDGGAEPTIADCYGATPLQALQKNMSKGFAGLSRINMADANACAMLFAQHPVSDSRVVKANKLRKRGNDAMLAGHLDVALQLYGESIAAHPHHFTYANRALVWLKKGELIEGRSPAVKDAATSTKMEPTYVKAWYRLVAAQMQVHDFPRALMACRNGLEHAPTSKPLLKVQAHLVACGVPYSIANPFSPASGEEMTRIRNGCNAVSCNYCGRPVVVPRNATKSCPHCACIPADDRATQLHDGSFKLRI